MKTPPCPVCGAQHWPHCRRCIPSWVRERYPLQVKPLTKAQQAELNRLLAARLEFFRLAAADDPPPF